MADNSNSGSEQEEVSSGEEETSDVDKVVTSTRRKPTYHFTGKDDINILNQVLIRKPGEKGSTGKWRAILDKLGLPVTGYRAILRRVELLLQAFIEQNDKTLRRFGDEEDYKEKMRLLAEVSSKIKDWGWNWDIDEIKLKAAMKPRKATDSSSDDSEGGTSDEEEREEDNTNMTAEGWRRRTFKTFKYKDKDDIKILQQVLIEKPSQTKSLEKWKIIWDRVGLPVKNYIAIKRRFGLLLGSAREQNLKTLRRRGTKKEHTEKMRLLTEVMSQIEDWGWDIEHLVNFGRVVEGYKAFIPKQKDPPCIKIKSVVATKLGKACLSETKSDGEEDDEILVTSKDLVRKQKPHYMYTDNDDIRILQEVLVEKPVRPDRWRAIFNKLCLPVKDYLAIKRRFALLLSAFREQNLKTLQKFGDMEAYEEKIRLLTDISSQIENWENEELNVHSTATSNVTESNIDQPPQHNQSQEKKRRKRWRCEVPICLNNANNAKPGTTFYTFPIGWRGLKWMEVIKNPNLKLSYWSRVCSEHFQEEDFEPDIRGDVFGTPYKKRLMRSAVPSIALPLHSEGSEQSELEEKQAEKSADFTESKAHNNTTGDYNDDEAFSINVRPLEEICSGNEKEVEHGEVAYVTSEDKAKAFGTRKGTKKSPRSHQSLASIALSGVTSGMQRLREPCLLCSDDKACAGNFTEAYQFPGACGSLSLNTQLWYTFLLRKVLNFPIHKVQDILRNVGTASSMWFQLCSDCSETMEEVVKMQEAVRVLQSKIAVKIELVYSKLNESLSKEENILLNDSPSKGKFASIRSEIRHFLKCQTVGPKVEKDMNAEQAENVNGNENIYEGKTSRDSYESMNQNFSFEDSEPEDNQGFFENNSDEDWTPLEEACKFKNKKWKDSNRKVAKDLNSVNSKNGNKKNKNTWKCDICSRKYYLKGAYEFHVELHQKTKQLHGGRFDCYLCQVPYENVDGLRTHLKRVHSLILDNSWDDSKPQNDHVHPSNTQNPLSKPAANKNRRKSILSERLICHSCPTSFLTIYALRKHLSLHVACKEHGIECPECNYPCRTADHLKKHLTIKHNIRENAFSCKICGYEANGNAMLQQHIYIHKLYDGSVNPAISTTELVCNLCHTTFKKRTELRTHKLKVHAEELGIPVFKCQECPRVFGRKDGFELHVLKDHKKVAKYYCEVCGYGAMNRSIYNTHLQTHNSEQLKQFICEHCSASYSTSQTLDVHLRRYHPEKYQWKRKVYLRKTAAEGSSSMVSSNPNLESVEEVKCKHCNTTLAHKLALKFHIKSVHQDLYVHNCDRCDKVYMSVASLQLHKKIHHSTKKGATCAYCLKKFTHRFSLYAHMSCCKKKPDNEKGPKILVLEEQKERMVIGKVNSFTDEN